MKVLKVGCNLNKEENFHSNVDKLLEWLHNNL